MAWKPWSNGSTEQTGAVADRAESSKTSERDKGEVVVCVGPIAGDMTNIYSDGGLLHELIHLGVHLRDEIAIQKPDAPFGFVHVVFPIVDGDHVTFGDRQ